MAGDQVKKRKKNAPDRPQPTWLFPSKEENPVLNPKPVSEDQILKAETERQDAIDFLKRRAYGVPDKPAPDPQLLNLIAVFLTEYGFSSTCRMFTTERKGRKTLKGWPDELGGKLKPGTPRLAKIYKDWLVEWEERRALDMTSDEDDDAATKRDKLVKRRANPKEKRSKVEDDQTSSSGGDSSSDEVPEADVEMKDAPPAQSAKHGKGASSGPSSSASSTSSSSESDADDEKETTAVKASSPKPTVNNLVNKLKRKATSELTIEAVSEDNPSVAKKAKLDTTPDNTKSEKKAGAEKKTKKTKADKHEKEAAAEEALESARPAKGEKKAKKSKADKHEKEVAAEEPLESAKPTKAEKKAKSAKKSDASASKETSANPAGSAPVAEPTSDSSPSPAQKPLPASSSSDSDSSSASSEPAPPKKTKSAKNKTTANPTSAPALSGDSKRKTSTDSSATLESSEPKKAAASSASSTSSSSSSSSSDSDSDSASTPPPKQTKTEKTKSKSSKSDPQTNNNNPVTTSTSSSDPNPEDGKTGKKHDKKKQGTPFSRIPASTTVDPRVASNAYVPYDYAERAHGDLIVKKGKGFKKEKDKKKRGSYRGGVIDVEGRKGIRFE